MGMIEYNGYVSIYGTDKQKIQKCKIIEGTSCGKCRNRIARGSICLGKGQEKFCLNCADFIFREVERAFTDFMNIMWETKKDLELNKEKYETHNLACNI